MFGDLIQNYLVALFLVFYIQKLFEQFPNTRTTFHCHISKLRSFYRNYWQSTLYSQAFCLGCVCWEPAAARLVRPRRREVVNGLEASRLSNLWPFILWREKMSMKINLVKVIDVGPLDSQSSDPSIFGGNEKRRSENEIWSSDSESDRREAPRLSNFNYGDSYIW